MIRGQLIFLLLFFIIISNNIFGAKSYTYGMSLGISFWGINTMYFSSGFCFERYRFGGRINYISYTAFGCDFEFFPGESYIIHPKFTRSILFNYFRKHQLNPIDKQHQWIELLPFFSIGSKFELLSANSNNIWITPEIGMLVKSFKNDIKLTMTYGFDFPCKEIDYERDNHLISIKIVINTNILRKSHSPLRPARDW